MPHLFPFNDWAPFSLPFFQPSRDKLGRKRRKTTHCAVRPSLSFFIGSPQPILCFPTSLIFFFLPSPCDKRSTKAVLHVSLFSSSLDSSSLLLSPIHCTTAIMTKGRGERRRGWKMLQSLPPPLLSSLLPRGKNFEFVIPRRRTGRNRKTQFSPIFPNINLPPLFPTNCPSAPRRIKF